MIYWTRRTEARNLKQDHKFSEYMEVTSTISFNTKTKRQKKKGKTIQNRKEY